MAAIGQLRNSKAPELPSKYNITSFHAKLIKLKDSVLRLILMSITTVLIVHNASKFVPFVQCVIISKSFPTTKGKLAGLGLILIPFLFVVMCTQVTKEEEYSEKCTMLPAHGAILGTKYIVFNLERVQYGSL
eukprot:g39551.t1